MSSPLSQNLRFHDVVAVKSMKRTVPSTFQLGTARREPWDEPIPTHSTSIPPYRPSGQNSARTAKELEGHNNGRPHPKRRLPQTNAHNLLNVNMLHQNSTRTIDGTCVFLGRAHTCWGPTAPNDLSEKVFHANVAPKRISESIAKCRCLDDIKWSWPRVLTRYSVSWNFLDRFSEVHGGGKPSCGDGP